MLDKNRIKEAESNVRKYTEEGLLKKIEVKNLNLLDVMKKNSEESLMAADFLFKNNMSWLWVIVCSYYSMFYLVNAILYKSGYKIGDKIVHKVAEDSLIALIRNKLKNKLIEDFEEAKAEAVELAGLRADELIQNFGYELGKRGIFQYEMSEIAKKSKAETSLKRAREFALEMAKLLL